MFKYVLKNHVENPYTVGNPTNNELDEEWGNDHSPLPFSIIFSHIQITLGGDHNHLGTERDITFEIKEKTVDTVFYSYKL